MAPPNQLDSFFQKIFPPILQRKTMRPRRHLTRDLAARLALSLSLITPNKLIETMEKKPRTQETAEAAFAASSQGN
jgi:hypothetical protein